MNDFPKIDSVWYNVSNYLCLLSVRNENDLMFLIQDLKDKNIKFSVFREPDIGDQVTAIAIEPGTKSKRICSKLSLALLGEKIAC